MAILERPVERDRITEEWVQPPSRLAPFREWLTVQDASLGLAVAFKGLYDYEAVPNPLTGEPDIFVTLLRGIGIMGRINTMQRKGGASDAFPTPVAQCPGTHVFEWCYVPYNTVQDDKAPFLPVIQSFLYPPVTHMIRPVSSDIPVEKNPLITKDIYRCDNQNIQFSAFKRCHNKSGYILRFYENQGIQTEAEIFIGPFTEAWKCNLNEEILEPAEINDKHIRLLFGPYKIVTIKLSL